MISVKNRKKANDTTLSKYVWEVEDKYKQTPSLKWSTVKSAQGYSNITKKCLPEVDLGLLQRLVS